MASRNPIRESSISSPPTKRRKTAPPVDNRRRMEISDPGHIAIYTWNINGIAPFVQRLITSFFKAVDGQGRTRQNESAPSASLREVLHRHHWPTMLFRQEVKINPDDASTQRAVEKAVLPGEDEPSGQPSYQVFFCLPSDKHNERGFGRKVYGMCSIIRQDFVDRNVERFREVDWDVEGCFLVCETKAVSRLPKLAIFNIYAVHGTDASYKHPETGQVVGSRHDRKLQVHKLLQAECRAMEAKGVEVILAGDRNIARAPIDGYPNLRTFPRQYCLNRAHFEARLFEDGDGDTGSERGLDLVDSFRRLHQDQSGYTYYPRGKPFGSSCDRVDLILMSSSLGRYLVEANILETPADRGSSDHVPSFINLSFDIAADKTDG